MADYTFIVYGDDDETPLFEVGTNPAHAKPWLRVPTEFAESEIDLLQGQAQIGQYNLEVIDPQSGANQTIRGLSGLLGNADGNSAVNWRRAVFRQVNPDVLIMDGVAYGQKLNDDFVTYVFYLRDIRERGRKVSMFTRGGTTTIFPRGVVGGYGLGPDGEWLVPPAVPIQGTYHAIDSTQGQIWLTSLPAFPTQLIATQQAKEAARVVIDPETSVAYYPDVEIWWRPVGETTWRVHSRMRTPTFYFDVPSSGAVLKLLNRLFETVSGTYSTPSGKKHSVEFIQRLYLQETDTQATPDDEEDVEFLVVYVGEASESYPVHFEGTRGELLRNAMRGDYCFDADGNPVDPRLRYDESRLVGASALPVLAAPARARFIKPVDDLREFIEDVCKSLGVAPALDSLGRITIIDSALPPADAVLPEINDTVAEAIAGWEHPGSTAITQIDMDYYRDYLVETSDDPLAERSSSDGIASVKQSISIKPKNSIIQQVVGVKPHKIDGFLFRAIGTSNGTPAGNREVMDESGAQFATGRGYEIIDRWVFGGQVGFRRVNALDADMAALKVGDWVLDAVSWRPNYSTGTRGGNHLAQVVSIKDVSPAIREVRLVDASPFDNPVGQPTLGTLSLGDRDELEVLVTSIPADVEARVEYAISPTLPANSSPLWTFLGRTEVATTLVSPPNPSGVTLWVRARGERAGYRPSAWTNAVSITVSNTPRILSLVLEVSINTVVVRGTVNQHTAGVRIYYAVHDVGEDPGTLVEFRDFDASLDEWLLTGVTVRNGQAVTVEVEPWSGWNGTAVTGTAGPERMARTLQVSAPAPITTATWARQGEGRILRLSVEPGAATIHYRLDGIGDWISVPGPTVDIAIDLSEGSRSIQFYSTMAGRPVEDVKDMQLDADADPEFDSVLLTESSANRLKVAIVGHDDDCVRFGVWAKVGALPYLVGDDGNPSKEPDPKFLRDSGEMNRQPRIFHAITGRWYVIVRAYDERGRYIERIGRSYPDPGSDPDGVPYIDIAGAAPPAQPELSSVQVALVGSSHRITWSHNGSVGSGHRVVIRESVGSTVRDVLTLAAARPPTWEAGASSDTVAGGGGYDVAIQTGSTFKHFDYEVMLYDGPLYLRSYFVSREGSDYASGGGGGGGKPTGSPTNVVAVGNGTAALRTTWVNSSELWNIELLYEWYDNGEWRTYFFTQVGQGLTLHDQPGLNSFRTVRVWTRYVNSFGAGPWSSPSPEVVVP